MDYKEKYEEALEKARYVLHTIETAGCAMHKDLLEEIIPEQPGCRENDIYEEWSLAPIEGAENQEYIALTWEDIQTIHSIILDLADDEDFPPLSKEFYEEVLRRFNETKNK